jgi:iron complex outermembrane receptor protein
MGGIEWQSLPVSNLEKVEVIRGGQNVLYGNHALSGVVKITTKRGEDAGLQLNGAMGSYGYYSGSASYGGTVGDTDFLGGLQYSQYDGYRDNSSTESTSANASAGWYMNDTDTLTLRASGGKSYLQFPGPLTYQQMQDDPTQSRNLGDEFSDSVSGQATLLYETERDWGAARMNTGLSFVNRENDISGIYNQNDILGFSLAPRARFGSEDDFWMTGLDFFYDQLDQENYQDPARSIVRSWADISRITAAPYLFAQRTVAEKTVINGGARYEYAGTDNHYVEYDFFGVVDPAKSYDGVVEKQGWAAELSVSRQLTKPLGFFAGYDRVYRYPTLDETASYQGFPLSDPLNENLDPEQGNNFEVGTTYEGRTWRVSLTGFYLSLDNEIAYDDVENLNRNIGATRRIGLEPELVWKKQWCGASTRWTFVDAQFDSGANDGNRVPLVPWAYGVTAAWIEPLARLRLSASYTYVSEQYQGNDEANTLRRMDDYGLVGLRANLALMDSLNLYITVHNLLDETYATAAYSGGYYPGSGRSFRAGITKVY